MDSTGLTLELDSAHLMLDAADLMLDSNSETNFRCRANTWPQQPARQPNSSPVASEQLPAEVDPRVSGHRIDCHGPATKKTGCRRNAWGNLSYADLITRAIQSSPETRLTLSQIYDWMVQNVPYFKDKGDSTSSAGWKNSIRHNLSLHSRFMRIQNEGTGKSSWWVLNPDAKPGKTPRRRAGSMEAKFYDKKPGRVRKRVDVLRAGSDSNLGLASCDEFLDTLNLTDFQSRTDSSANSCSRQSSMGAVAASDPGACQLPAASWVSDGSSTSSRPEASPVITDSLYSDLLDSLVQGITLSSQHSYSYSSPSYSSPSHYMRNSSNHLPSNDLSQTILDLENIGQSSLDLDNIGQVTLHLDNIGQANLDLDNYGQPTLDLSSTYNSLPPSLYCHQQQQPPLGFHSLASVQSRQSFNSSLRQPIKHGAAGSTSANFSQPEVCLLHNTEIKQEAASPRPNGMSAACQHQSPEHGSPGLTCYGQSSPQLQPLMGVSCQLQTSMGVSPHASQIVSQPNQHVPPAQMTPPPSPLSQQALHQAACESILRQALAPSGGRPYNRFPRNIGAASGHRMSYCMTDAVPRSVLTVTSHHTRSTGHCVSDLRQRRTVNSCASLALNSNASLALNSRASLALNSRANLALNSCGSLALNTCSNRGLPLDLDLGMASCQLDHDMGQLITHELSMEANLDFLSDVSVSSPMVAPSIVH